MSEPIIKVRGLHKYFGPLHVIKGVDLDEESRNQLIVFIWIVTCKGICR